MFKSVRARESDRWPTGQNRTKRPEKTRKHSSGGTASGPRCSFPAKAAQPHACAKKKSLRKIAAESRALTERARTNKLRSDDLGGGTVTISNLGMFDVDEFIAIINPPEAAILAVGAVTRRPVAAAGEVRIASLMKTTLSVDHRVADGAQAGRFMQEFKKLLENPVNLLAD